MNKRALGCLAGLLAGAALPVLAAPQEVHFANWADYIGPTVLQDFQKETGIRVVLDAFESDEVLEAKLLTGHSGFDVVVPSADFLARQLKAGVYRPLDDALLPNRKNLDPDLLARVAQSDPGNRFAVPYLWGTVGIGYNPAKIKAALGADAPLDSWDLVFKPENLAKLKGCGVALLDSPAKILPLALHYLGKDPNSNNPADYEAGTKLLESLKPSVTYFSSTKYIADLANGNICVAIGFSGDVLQAQKSAQEAGGAVDVQYSVPKEGTNIWFDNLAIPKDARNPEGAHAFINYLLRPDVIARTSDYLHYANANVPAKALMDQKVRENPAVYPNAELVKGMYVSLPPSPSILRLITRDWSRIKSGV
jgi:putrescine transport system substrate-binding protein